jgi:hypothetical protein
MKNRWELRILEAAAVHSQQLMRYFVPLNYSKAVFYILA